MQGLDMYNSWTFEEEDERKYPANILDKFMGHLEPRTNHRIHTYTLQGIRQGQYLAIYNPEIQKSLIGRDEKTIAKHWHRYC